VISSDELAQRAQRAQQRFLDEKSTRFARQQTRALISLSNEIDTGLNEKNVEIFGGASHVGEGPPTTTAPERARR
jgi:hypothetical protein